MIHRPNHPHRLTRGLVLLAGLCAAVPGTLLGLRMNPDLLDHGLTGQGLLNPDSAMRLLRLHDTIAAGAPTHAVMRDGSGAGTVLHWSHLLDSLLLLLAAPLAPLLGWDAALHAVGRAQRSRLRWSPWGLRSRGPRCPSRGGGWAWLGAFAAGASPLIGGYGMPGVVHHHVLLAVCAVMAGGWALRLVRDAEPAATGAPVSNTQVPGGLALGAWAAAGLWLSPETTPFSLLAMGALWAAWVAAPRQSAAARRLADALVACGAAFAALILAAWLADPPAAGYAAVEPDRISLPSCCWRPTRC